MKILAIDQATRHSGFCLSKDGVILRCGTVNMANNKDIPHRINSFKNWVETECKKNKVDLVVFEDIQYQNNQRTYKILAQLLGVLSDMAYSNNIDFHIVPPVVWKSHCGIKGRARKEQKANTIAYVKEKTGMDVKEDTADAIAINMYAIEKFKEGALLSEKEK